MAGAWAGEESISLGRIDLAGMGGGFVILCVRGRGL